MSIIQALLDAHDYILFDPDEKVVTSGLFVPDVNGKHTLFEFGSCCGMRSFDFTMMRPATKFDRNPVAVFYDANQKRYRYL